MLFVAGAIASPDAFSQFSPGELSRAHHNLEGTQNCTKCHEIGKEILGSKCLTCHSEIQQQLDRQRGYHFVFSRNEPCVKCHKEHLGPEAHTVKFDPATFDHSSLGFPLAGKHRNLQCASCHTGAHVADVHVRNLQSIFPHPTYMGLDRKCNSCHQDVHKGLLPGECSSCHTSEQWKDVSAFRHTATKFPLIGKHEQVACAKCHTSMHATPAAVNFATALFEDCTPCHASPHRTKFPDSERCSSCHSPQGWEQQGQKAFDHNRTGFKLTGKHVTVKCEGCHKAKSGSPGTQLKPRRDCADCHADKHNGEFLAPYKNNCATCHSDRGFTPSTFTLERHNETRFRLDGSHLSLPCRQCHVRTGDKGMVFRFASLRCETCHRDVHKGKFTRAAASACTDCHTTGDWLATSFDHAAATGYKLEGQHASVPCAKCHREETGAGAGTRTFSKLQRECEACHRDQHARQFASGSGTDCSKCHAPAGWKRLTFDHERQSAFSLKGAHLKISCASCHHSEVIDAVATVRYKPVATQCESCHSRRSTQQ
jgi:hypothetical protein